MDKETKKTRDDLTWNTKNNKKTALIKTTAMQETDQNPDTFFI